MPLSPTPTRGAKTSSSEEGGMGQGISGAEPRHKLGAHPPLQGEGRERSERGGVTVVAAGAGTPPGPPMRGQCSRQAQRPHRDAELAPGVDPPPAGEGEERAFAWPPSIASAYRHTGVAA